MAELTGTPLENSPEKQCLNSTSRSPMKAGTGSTMPANCRCRHGHGPRTLSAGFLRPRADGPGGAVIDRDFEVLVYTWTARLKALIITG
jgi:hypothetical protein